MASLTLTGYSPSVYSRAARIALHELALPYDWIEVDPFDPEGARSLRVLHPFARVPVLQDGDATVYETRAILAYLDAKFGCAGKRTPLQIARIAQVQGIVDAYGYWPLVRQVYSHGVFSPASGETGNEGEVAAGLRAAPAVLDALEATAAEGAVLDGLQSSPADWHLAPMIAAFVQVPRAADLVAARPHLNAWFKAMEARESMPMTAFDLERTT